MSFKNWKSMIDSELIDIAGVESDDLVDFDYYGAYEAGEDATLVAYEVLKENGWTEDVRIF